MWVWYVWSADVMNSRSVTLPVFNSHYTKISTIRTCATSDIVCLPTCMCGMMLMYVDNIPPATCSFALTARYKLQLKEQNAS